MKKLKLDPVRGFVIAMGIYLPGMFYLMQVQRLGNFLGVIFPKLGFITTIGFFAWICIACGLAILVVLDITDEYKRNRLARGFAYGLIFGIVAPVVAPLLLKYVEGLLRTHQIEH